MGYGDEVTVRRLLRYPTWAVVGLSANPQRPSYGVARFLQAHGVRVIPVNPNCGASVLGERAYCALADIPDPVVGGVVDHVELEPHAAYDRVRAAGIGMVMD